MSIYTFIPVIFIALYAGYWFYIKNKNSQQAQVVNNTDFKAEFANAEQYKKHFLNSDLPFLKKAMGEEKIDAFNYASNEYGVASALKDGVKDQHLVFNQARLENSKLTEILLEGEIKAQAQARGNNVRAYKLSLQTDNKPIELIIYSCLIFTKIPEIPTNPQETVQAIIIANDFLKQLGDKYPNLKVSLPIFN